MFLCLEPNKGIGYRAATMRTKDDRERVPIPLDPETIRRLARFGQATGLHPTDAAAALLRDLLADDEMWNEAANQEKRSRMN
jgi:hypothetical protein